MGVAEGTGVEPATNKSPCLDPNADSPRINGAIDLGDEGVTATLF